MCLCGNGGAARRRRARCAKSANVEAPRRRGNCPFAYLDMENNFRPRSFTCRFGVCADDELLTAALCIAHNVLKSPRRLSSQSRLSALYRLGKYGEPRRMTNEGAAPEPEGTCMHTNTSTVLETASYVMYLLGRRLAINI